MWQTRETPSSSDTMLGLFKQTEIKTLQQKKEKEKEMLEIRQFIVPGHPRPQGRPRFYRTNRFIRSFDDPDSVSFKNKVAICAKNSGIKCLEGPISIIAEFYVKRPKKYRAKKYGSAALKCQTRPDIDNYVKAILDGLGGVAYYDDGQVWEVKASKYYHELDKEPRSVITIRRE